MLSEFMLYWGICNRVAVFGVIKVAIPTAAVDFSLKLKPLQRQTAYSAPPFLEWHSRGQRFDPAYLHREEALKT
jgi:hypothetical protein